MRKLTHPSIADITVESILYAFSDPVRLRIFMDLADAECSKNCSTYLNISQTPLPKSTLSQHFSVLREAGLIFSERKGVELHNRTRCSELKNKFGDMITAIVMTYAAQLKKQQKGKKSAPIKKSAKATK